MSIQQKNVKGIEPGSNNPYNTLSSVKQNTKYQDRDTSINVENLFSRTSWKKFVFKYMKNAFKPEDYVNDPNVPEVKHDRHEGRLISPFIEKIIMYAKSFFKTTSNLIGPLKTKKKKDDTKYSYNLNLMVRCMG